MSDYAEVVRREFPCCGGHGGFDCGVMVDHVEECAALYRPEAQRVYDAAKRAEARAARVATLRDELDRLGSQGHLDAGVVLVTMIQRWRAELEEAERERP